MRYSTQYMGFNREDMATEGKKIIMDREFNTLKEAVEDSEKLLKDTKEIWQATIRDNELDGESVAFISRDKRGSDKIIVDYEKQKEKK